MRTYSGGDWPHEGVGFGCLRGACGFRVGVLKVELRSFVLRHGLFMALAYHSGTRGDTRRDGRSPDVVGVSRILDPAMYPFLLFSGSV